jgi:tetratricopeptide (TPR) repeat protein
VWAALADGEDVLVPTRPGLPDDRLAALHAALAEGAGDDAIADAAEAYAKVEPHAEVAARALLTAAEAVTRTAARGRLARAALVRTGLEVAADVARAIELASEDDANDANLAWEPLARHLRDPAVARARGLALERAGRAEGALGPLSDALRADEGDVLAQRGLARALAQLGRHDEALTAWDRVVDRTIGEARSRARLEAARAAEAAGLREASIARLEALVSERPLGALGLEAQGALARLTAAAGQSARAAELDRALPALADALGPMFAAEAADALRAAIARALAASEPTRARALLDALARVAPGARDLAAHEAALATVVEASLARTDPKMLRARAEALRAAGKPGEAARALIEAFVQTSDAAVLRAAVELAERSADAVTLRAVIDRALSALPVGPARASLEARRAKLEGSR